MVVAQVHVIHVGRGVEAPQGAVEIDRLGLEGDRQALRQHDLHRVAVDDVLARLLHRILVPLFGEL